MCSATLHSFDVKKLSEKIMHFPTWVDLKGEDSVPETVHHVVVPVNPKADKLWERLGKNHIRVSVCMLNLMLFGHIYVFNFQNWGLMWDFASSVYLKWFLQWWSA